MRNTEITGRDLLGPSGQLVQGSNEANRNKPGQQYNKDSSDKREGENDIS